jgi:phosphoglucomutase
VDAVFTHLEASLNALTGKQFGSRTVKLADNFSYTDPVDASVSGNQGIRILFEDGARIIYRRSGTGTSGATLRLYVEHFEADAARFNEETQSVLKDLLELADEIATLTTLTGRQAADVIT